MTDDPDFYAWLDGELPEREASAMAARVAADPQLAAFAEQHRALAGRLSDAFAPILLAPVPERVSRAAERRQAEVVDLAEVRARQRQWSVAGMAAAASLALGLAIGTAMPRDSSSFESSGGKLAAAGPLATALDRQLAAAGDQRGIRLGLSFKDRGGRYCRTFNTQAQSGLACLHGEDWAIEGLVGAGASDGEYRMASGVDPGLAAIVDSRLAGEPLDAAAEAQAVERRWRN
jgi:hypothetical protein